MLIYIVKSYVVCINSSTINQFKNKLNRHWCTQEMVYDYKAELAGILSRSDTEYNLLVFPAVKEF